MHRLAPFALALTLAATAAAQTPQFTDPANLRGERVSPRTGRELPIDQGALGLQQLLRKLNTRASLMLIVAHPDDEDGGMLTLYSRGMGARVADLSLNRGEGGQNAMTGDFEDALGLLRTQELLSADRYSDVDQFFGTEVDFGFSKTKEESFAKWGHDRVLYDVVRSIRLYRPLVIASVFIGGVTDGHGQHQVAGQIAQEAFKAAGDPTVFPDMIVEGILPWQPLKVYARVPTQSITPQGLFDYATNQYAPARFTNYVSGEVTTTPPSVDVVIHEGVTDPLLTRSAANSGDLAGSYLAASSTAANANEPLTYVQFARIGLGLQKSQIGPSVRLAPTGAFDIGYHLYGSCLPGSDTAKFCHLDALASSTAIDSGPSASGATHTSLGRSPTSTPTPDAEGLKARHIDDASSPGFFEGIDTTLESIADYAPDAFPAGSLAAINQQIQTTAQQLNPSDPSAIAPNLAAALKDIDPLIDTIQKWQGDPIAKANILHELRIKRVQLNDAIVLALGLTLEATTIRYGDQIADSRIPVSLTLHTGSNKHLTLTKSSVTNQNRIVYESNPLRLMRSSVSSDSAYHGSIEVPSNLTTIITRPYFIRSSVETPVYTLIERAFRNAPATNPAITAWVTAAFRGTSIELGRIVKDDRGQPVRIVPPANLGTWPTRVFIKPAHPFDFLVDVRDGDATKLMLQVPSGWTSRSKMMGRFSRLSIFSFTISPTEQPSSGTISVSLPTANGLVTDEYQAIGYGDLPITNFYRPAITRIEPVDLELPDRHNIGYLPGTGDAVPDALSSIGLAPTMLTVADLTPDKLSQFDTVILGVRTYNAHPDLHGGPTQALLDFARAGGNVVVQYQSPEFTAADAPYQLSLGSNEKVVDETAAVALPPLSSQAQSSKLVPNPALALLTTPNKITTADFDSWIEERGHGFLATWDDHYTALTETHDSDQAPQRGGLITTKLGKGRWTYCAFALYRQLPEAVPGAFRLFVNLLDPDK